MFESASPRKAVEFAIKTEELGAEVYRRLATKFSDKPDVKQLFLTLAQDEERHAAQFRALRELVDESERRSYPEKYGEIRAVAVREFFSKRDGLMRAPETIETAVDALQRALDMEHASIQFYKEVEGVIGEHEALTAILDAEREHAASVSRVLLSVGKSMSASRDSVTHAS
jgi:rubrerythrin